MAKNPKVGPGMKNLGGPKNVPTVGPLPTPKKERYSVFSRARSFNVKRDQGGKGFSMMIRKKIKGFEEEKEDEMEQIEENSTEAPTIEEPVVEISDLVVHAIDQKPLDFQQTFADLMQQRIEDAVHQQKLAIAADFIGASANTDPSDDDSDWGEEEEEDEDDDNKGSAEEDKDWDGTEFEPGESEEDLDPGQPEEE